MDETNHSNKHNFNLRKNLATIERFRIEFTAKEKGEVRVYISLKDEYIYKNGEK